MRAASQSVGLSTSHYERPGGGHDVGSAQRRAHGERSRIAETGGTAQVFARPRLKAYLVSGRRVAFNNDGIFRRYPELDA